MPIFSIDRLNACIACVDAIDDIASAYNTPDADAVRANTETLRTELLILRDGHAPQRGDKVACEGAGYKDRA